MHEKRGIHTETRYDTRVRRGTMLKDGGIAEPISAHMKLLNFGR